MKCCDCLHINEPLDHFSRFATPWIALNNIRDTSFLSSNGLEIVLSSHFHTLSFSSATTSLVAKTKRETEKHFHNYASK